MSNVAHTIADMYRERLEAADELRWQDETQVNIRVGPDVVAALDFLAHELGISRAAAAKHVVAAGIHDALEVLRHQVTFRTGEGWTVSAMPDGKAGE